ncbi:SLAM family member 9-like [Sinocyclocheilus rhinocerous]|uniref:SLAM family member 9-like n=1 Tax=Sinocyclocheilus rhinocerous TaxID=307959 RepID=UPI0007BA4B06|nr:PREDICTED: SLAM family member 9-like [Sinocyclocheilus rhinocerous]
MMFKEKTFVVVWFGFTCLVGVFGETDTVKSVSVLEGDSVTLNSSLTEIQTDHKIAWHFGNERSLIARINRETKKILVFDVSFKNRLKLDSQTGSLTIDKTRTTDSGLYEVSISNSSTETKYRFNVTVYARLPVPVISSNSSNCSSPSMSKCSFLCSVVNVGHGTLSWYKGNSLLSSISVSDLSISLSLPLEIECLDDSYSCVLNNPISHQTTHLNNTQHCPTCSVKDVLMMLLISAAAGSLLIVAAVRIYWIYKKHRKIDQEVQTRTEEIIYTDPMFHKRNAQRASVKQEDDAVYASVVHKR